MERRGSGWYAYACDVRDALAMRRLPRIDWMGSILILKITFTFLNFIYIYIYA